MRTSVALIACACCWVMAAGCAHMTESRVANAFAESLKEHDLARLKEQTSTDFEEKAVLGEATFDVLKQVKLPEGKVRVVKVINKKDESDKRKIIEKRVTVQVGEKKTGPKYVLRLKLEEDKWVVDNVYLSRKDEKANKSLALKLAVLVGLHDALEAWKAADRDQMLACATPEFSQALSELPPEQLTRFAKQITTDVAEQSSVMAQDRIGEETADLRVSRGTQGELEMKLRQLDGHWKLDDMQVHSRRAGDDIASVRQVTAAVAAAHEFQRAYQESDKRRLEKTTTPQFFTGSLANAELSLVKLPSANDTEQKFDVRLDGNAATYVVSAGSEVLKISLARQDNQKYHQAPKYLVDDVTIYELDGSQDKRLSALFTGHATLAAFSNALATHDLEALQANATFDFNQRVWSQIRAMSRLVVSPGRSVDLDQRVWSPIHNAQFPGMAPAEARRSPPKIVQTDFKGSMTEVLVEQGEVPLTYVLRDEGGRMLVDDVLVPATSRPESLKTNVELLLPVLEFSLAFEHSLMDDVRGVSTAEFSRIAWNHFYDQAPEFDHDPLPHLQQSMSALRVNNDKAVVVLGNGRFGSEIRLEKERGRFRIDEIILVSGPADGQKIGLRRMSRAVTGTPRRRLASNAADLPILSDRDAQD